MLEKSHLLAMPLEIRHKIYQWIYYKSSIFLDDVVAVTLPNNAQDRAEGCDPLLPVKVNGRIEILLVCHQLHDEAEPFLSRAHELICTPTTGGF